MQCTNTGTRWLSFNENEADVVTAADTASEAKREITYLLIFGWEGRKG